jgi:hypothetical protein
MLPEGFEHTIPASERPQTHALDRAATGIFNVNYIIKSIMTVTNMFTQPFKAESANVLC